MSVLRIGRFGLLYVNAITGLEHVDATDETVAYLLVRMGKKSMRIIGIRIAPLQCKSPDSRVFGLRARLL